MKIYTKTGDKGQTSLFGGERVKKNNQRIIAYGTLDELNAVLGIVRSYSTNNEINNDLILIQTNLFILGAELASPRFNGKVMIEEKEITFLEAKIDFMDNLLEPLTHFILPGGNSLAEAFCQQARTICRRTEREVILLNETEELRAVTIQFLNRLSDYLFVLGRYFLKLNNQQPIQWK